MKTKLASTQNLTIGDTVRRGCQLLTVTGLTPVTTSYGSKLIRVAVAAVEQHSNFPSCEEITCSPSSYWQRVA